MKRKDHIVQAILYAGSSEFLAKGFNGASMEQISKNAEISKATLYKYYPSKQKVFEAILEDTFEKAKNSQEFTYSDEKPIESMWSSIVEKKVDLLTSPYLIKMATLLIMVQIHEDRASAIMDKYSEGLTKSLKSWASQCQQSKKLSSDFTAEEIVESFRLMAKATFLWPVVLKLREPFKAREIQKEKELFVRKLLKLFS